MSEAHSRSQVECVGGRWVVRVGDELIDIHDSITNLLTQERNLTAMGRPSLLTRQKWAPIFLIGDQSTRE